MRNSIWWKDEKSNEKETLFNSFRLELVAICPLDALPFNENKCCQTFIQRAKEKWVSIQWSVNVNRAKLAAEPKLIESEMDQEPASKPIIWAIPVFIPPHIGAFSAQVIDFLFIFN